MLAYGGSVMDCVKIISASAKAPKDYWKLFFEDHQTVTDGTTWGAVVTLSGTGSEMNGGAGINNTTLRKKLLCHGSA